MLSPTLLNFISTVFSSQHLLPSILWANRWSFVAEEIWSLYQGWWRCINPSIWHRSAAARVLGTVDNISPVSAQFESLALREWQVACPKAELLKMRQEQQVKMRGTSASTLLGPSEWATVSALSSSTETQLKLLLNCLRLAAFPFCVLGFDLT